MDISLVIRRRLAELEADQKGLAAAVQVTESYISQLLSRKKVPPAPSRTDIYDKMDVFLKLPVGELARMADIQRAEERKRRVLTPPRPLFGEFRELLLRKCQSGVRPEVRRIFEKEPFGELERLVSQKLLEITQGIARDELRNEEWLRVMAQLSSRSYEEMRVAVLELLDSDVFQVSLESCTSFLDPMIDSWDIELATFSMDVILNRRLAPVRVKRFEFVEQVAHRAQPIEAGLQQFLNDRQMSGDAVEEELAFLGRLRFTNRRPTALYYYRELQNLRDPLHFTTAVPSSEQSPRSLPQTDRRTS